MQASSSWWCPKSYPSCGCYTGQELNRPFQHGHTSTSPFGQCHQKSKVWSVSIKKLSKREQKRVSISRPTAATINADTGRANQHHSPYNGVVVAGWMAVVAALTDNDLNLVMERNNDTCLRPHAREPNWSISQVKVVHWQAEVPLITILSV